MLGSTLKFNSAELAMKYTVNELIRHCQHKKLVPLFKFSSINQDEFVRRMQKMIAMNFMPCPKTTAQDYKLTSHQINVLLLSC
jgi:hypothetical protein